ncbi:MAG: NAD-dependent epimerase/dehydratase family protein [Jatrophihabitantaceae bacterium]
MSGSVVVTGAAGAIGTTLRERLPGYGWALRCLDIRSAEGVTVGDITAPDVLDEVVAGADAIVHLAGQPTEAPWPVIRDANLDGTFAVFEAARRHRVPRVVYASSNHAAGFTPVPAETQLPADAPPRPDTLYGVSKVFGEALGRYYADRYDLRVACLRIGTFAPSPPDLRSLSTWLSPADCARLVDACLRCDTLSYSIVWGISANTRRTWSLAAGEALGYFPGDDAEVHAAALPDSQAHPSDAFVGGGYTSPGFGIDEVGDRW